MNTKRLFLLILLTAFFDCVLFGQEYRIAVKPQKESRYGYMDLSGTMIIPPQSTLGLPFSEDGTVIIVKYFNNLSNNKMIDKNGNEIETEVEIKLATNQWTDEVVGHSDGMYVQKDIKYYGALNCEGKLTVPFLYSMLTSFNDGFAIGRREKVYYVIDKEGNETPIERNNEITYVKRFSEGLAPIELNNKRFGFVNSEGVFVIEPQYKTVGYFNGGYAWVRIKNGKIGFINKRGEWVVDPHFAVAYNFDAESGLAIVQLSSKSSWWYYTDTVGHLIDFGRMSNKYYSFSEGLAFLKKGLFGYINNKGEWVVEPSFKEVRPFRNGYAAVRKGKLWGLINKKGEWVLPPDYKELGDVVEIE